MLKCTSLERCIWLKCINYVVTAIVVFTFLIPPPVFAAPYVASALAPKSIFKEKKPVYTEPRLFTQEKLFGGTPLWDAFTAMNKDEEPAVVYLTGDEDQARAQFRQQIKEIPDTRLVCLSLEVETTELDKMDKDPARPRDVVRHIVVVDSAGVLKRDIKNILKGHGRLNDYHFYLNIGEYQAARNVHLYRIALGKKSKSIKRLQGKGLMSEPLDRIADSVTSNFPGYTMTAYASNRPAIKHFFASRGMSPQFATRIFDRERREKTYYMIQSYEGYGVEKKDMLIAQLPARSKRRSAGFKIPAAGAAAPRGFTDADVKAAAEALTEKFADAVSVKRSAAGEMVLVVTDIQNKIEGVKILPGATRDDDLANLRESDGAVIVVSDLFLNIFADSLEGNRPEKAKQALLILVRHEYGEEVLAGKMGIAPEDRHAFISAVDALSEKTPLHPLMQYALPVMSEKRLGAVAYEHPNDPDHLVYYAARFEMLKRKLHAQGGIKAGSPAARMRDELLKAIDTENVELIRLVLMNAAEGGQGEDETRLLHLLDTLLQPDADLAALLSAMYGNLLGGRPPNPLDRGRIIEQHLKERDLLDNAA